MPEREGQGLLAREVASLVITSGVLAALWWLARLFPIVWFIAVPVVLRYGIHACAWAVRRRAARHRDPVHLLAEAVVLSVVRSREAGNTPRQMVRGSVEQDPQ
jgi:Flp pilus assembly protein TadB